MNAAAALLEAGIVSLPVDLRQVAEFFSIKLVDYTACTEIYDMNIEQLYSEISLYGFSFCDEGQFVCAVNGNACGKTRRRWTMAHEISHILMGHVSGAAERLSEECERQADSFAAELLAPLDVLHFCGVSSAEEIARLCGLSRQAAQYRFEELSKLRRQHSALMRAALRGESAEQAFLADEERKKLFERFLPFIAGYITERSRHDSYAEYLKRLGTDKMQIE